MANVEKKKDQVGMENQEARIKTKELESKVKYIGVVYRNSQQTIELAKLCHYDANTNRSVRDAMEFVMIIEKVLEFCSDSTRLIIRNEYLEIHDRYWYMEFFRSNHFYLLRRKALDEFMSCFNNLYKL